MNENEEMKLFIKKLLNHGLDNIPGDSAEKLARGMDLSRPTIYRLATGKTTLNPFFQKLGLSSLIKVLVDNLYKDIDGFQKLVIGFTKNDPEKQKVLHHAFDISKPTLERWEEGKNMPHREMVPIVVHYILKETL